MAGVARLSAFPRIEPYPPPVPAPPPRRSFWYRMIEAVMDAQHRDAERAVAQYVARRGKLTDEMEREIADHISGRRSGGLF